MWHLVTLVNDVEITPVVSIYLTSLPGSRHIPDIPEIMRKLPDLEEAGAAMHRWRNADGVSPNAPIFDIPLVQFGDGWGWGMWIFPEVQIA